MTAADTECAREALIRTYLDAYNHKDVPAMLDTLAPDIGFENISSGVVTARAQGREEFRQLAEFGATLFSERTQRLLALRHEAERSVADIHFRGTLAQDLPDGPAAGTAIELQGVSKFEFADGRLRRIVDRS